MTVERYLRAIAGFFVLVSIILAHFHSPYWLLFTGFVGLESAAISFYQLVPDDDHT